MATAMAASTTTAGSLAGLFFRYQHEVAGPPIPLKKAGSISL
jgi:hypothetical protein